MEKEADPMMNIRPPSSFASPLAASTTFVQADAATFRELVQKLTGASSEQLPLKPLAGRRLSSKPAADSTTVRRPLFKLQERRQTTRKLEIKLGLAPPCGPGPKSSPQEQKQRPAAAASPAPSPVTPLASESAFAGRVGTESPSSEEEIRAISEKGFYLHPSPRKPEPPELLTLFPLMSPRQQESENNKD